MVRVGILTLLLFTTGCHRYVPIDGGASLQGTQVRIHVSEARSQSIETMYGTGMAPLVGTVERWSEVVVLGVQVPAASGMLDRGLRNRVMIPSEDILSIELRELDRNRTVILAAGLATMVVVAAIAAVTGTFGGSTAVDPPVEQDSVIPMWGFDVPLWLNMFR